MVGAFPARPRGPLGWAVLAASLAATVAPFGCSRYVGTTAASFLRRVQEDPDPNARYLAYAKLGSPSCYETPEQKAGAVQTLVGKLEKGREPVASRAVIVHSLGELRDQGAREAVLKVVNDAEPVIRVQACIALGKVGRAEDATVLARVMTTDTLEDCRIAAIEALAELKPDDPRITRVLVNGLLQDDPATRLASLDALRKMTGRDLGVEPGPWQKMIEEQADTVVAGRDKKRPAAAANPTIVAKAPLVFPPPESPFEPLSRRDVGTKPAAYPPQPKPLAPYR